MLIKETNSDNKKAQLFVVSIIMGKKKRHCKLIRVLHSCWLPDTAFRPSHPPLPSSAVSKGTMEMLPCWVVVHGRKHGIGHCRAVSSSMMEKLGFHLAGLPVGDSLRKGEAREGMNVHVLEGFSLLDG